MNEYYVGASVTLTVTFTHDDTETDPTTVVFMVKEPTIGEVTIYTYGDGDDVVRDDPGVYHLVISVVASGTWVCRAVGTGAVEAAVEHEFLGLQSSF